MVYVLAVVFSLLGPFFFYWTLHTDRLLEVTFEHLLKVKVENLKKYAIYHAMRIMLSFFSFFGGCLGTLGGLFLFYVAFSGYSLPLETSDIKELFPWFF